MDRNGIKYAAGLAATCFLVWSGHPAWAGVVLGITLVIAA